MSWRAGHSLRTVLRQSLVLLAIAWGASVVVDTARLAITSAGLAGLVGIEPVDLWRFVKNAARMALLGDKYSMSPLWFLAALAVVRLLAAIAARVGVWVTVAMAAALLVGGFLASEAHTRNFYQLHLIGVAFVSFLAGGAARPLWTRIETSPRLAASVLLVAGAAFFATWPLNQGCPFDASARCGYSWINGEFGVTMIHGEFGNLALFAIAAIAGIAFASAATVLLTRAARGFAERCAGWGRSSLNLLIVNGLFVEFATPVISLWVAPLIAPGPVFFALLLIAMGAANLAAADALARPLRWLRNWARDTARLLTEPPPALLRAFAAPKRLRPRRRVWARRADRVSEAHE